MRLRNRVSIILYVTATTITTIIQIIVIQSCDIWKNKKGFKIIMSYCIYLLYVNLIYNT